MKRIGNIILYLLLIMAVLFPPYRVFKGLHWGFIFGSMINIKGIGKAVKIYEYIDFKVFVSELVIVIVLLLVFNYATKNKKSKKKRKKKR